MIRHASALVAITELEKTQIVERLGVPDNRVMVVPNWGGRGGEHCRTPILHFLMRRFSYSWGDWPM